MLKVTIERLNNLYYMSTRIEEDKELILQGKDSVLRTLQTIRKFRPIDELVVKEFSIADTEALKSILMED